MNFKTKVVAYVKKVPPGRVVSYGKVAAACGSPRAARQVGGILSGSDLLSDNVPWWRVVNSQGIISVKGNWLATKEMQKELLEKEGILVSKDYKVDIAEYGW